MHNQRAAQAVYRDVSTVSGEEVSRLPSSKIKLLEMPRVRYLEDKYLGG
jgi:hypothetical protein